VGRNFKVVLLFKILNNLVPLLAAASLCHPFINNSIYFLSQSFLVPFFQLLFIEIVCKSGSFHITVDDGFPLDKVIGEGMEIFDPAPHILIILIVSVLFL
jgi:hypothetical protein